MADNFIKIILDITNKMGLYLDVSYNNHWEGNLEHTIGIPSKKQVKRIIWRGFFFVRPKKQEIAFYAPDKPSINELERIYKLKSNIEVIDLLYLTSDFRHNSICKVRTHLKLTMSIFMELCK